MWRRRLDGIKARSGKGHEAKEGHHVADVEDTQVSWFFETCAHVKRGIQSDLNKLGKAIQCAKHEYEDYIQLANSEKRFHAFQERIAGMESDRELFPTEVVKTMSADMLALIEKGEHGALKLMRATGAKGVHDDLIANYMKRWKTALYRRAVQQYLVESQQELRWLSLKQCTETARIWLMAELEHVIREEPVEHDVADFIVCMLFPLKYRTCKNSSLPQHGYRTPESALEYAAADPNEMLEGDIVKKLKIK
jgi:hypothetical protein